MDVMQAINNRRSVREYDASRAIPDAVVERMRHALRAAPSACNYQPWHFIFVSDATLRQKLARIANDQNFIADAPIVVVACGEAAAAYKQMAGHGNSVMIDVAIALDHLTLAAVAEGLGTCWIGAFQEQPAKDLLGVPADMDIVAMIPLGYPASPELNHPLTDDRRKSASEIFSTNRYAAR